MYTIYSAAKEFLKSSLITYFERTESLRAKYILDHFDESISRFAVVVPDSEKGNPLLIKV